MGMPNRPSADFTHLSKKPTSDVLLLVAGPGGTAWYKSDIKEMSRNLAKAGISVAVVGDGQRDISVSEVAQAIKKLNAQGKKISGLFHITHGSLLTDDNLGLRFSGTEGDKQTLVRTSTYFAELEKANKGKPLDVLMVSCHGGAAHQVRDTLHVGSTLITLGRAGDSVDVTSFTGLARISADTPFTHPVRNINELLAVYLGRSVTEDKNDIPSISVSGKQGASDLGIELEAIAGHQMTPEQRELLHRKLDSFWGSERTDGWINRLENTKHPSQLGLYDSGPALLISHILKDPAFPIPDAHHNGPVDLVHNPLMGPAHDWHGIAPQKTHATVNSHGAASLHLEMTDGISINIPYPARQGPDAEKFSSSFTEYDPKTGWMIAYRHIDTHISNRNGETLLRGETLAFNGRYLINLRYDGNHTGRSEIYDTYRGETSTINDEGKLTAQNYGASLAPAYKLPELKKQLEDFQQTPVEPELIDMGPLKGTAAVSTLPPVPSPPKRALPTPLHLQ